MSEPRTTRLSNREEEIVQLSMDGMTNEGIAVQLGLSVGTINTYWLRIRLKVGGQGKTETVARIIKDRAEAALRSANVERAALTEMVRVKHQSVIEARAALALFQFAMSQVKSTVWATDRELVIGIIANGEFPSTHCGVEWVVGKTVYEIFKTSDPNDLAVAAHLSALEGGSTEVTLTGEFANMLLRVSPMEDESHQVLGCISILNVAGQ